MLANGSERESARERRVRIHPAERRSERSELMNAANDDDDDDEVREASPDLENKQKL